MLELHTTQVYTVDATAIIRARKNEKEQLRGDKAEVPPWETPSSLLISSFHMFIRMSLHLPTLFSEIIDIISSSILLYFSSWLCALKSSRSLSVLKLSNTCRSLLLRWSSGSPCILCILYLLRQYDWSLVPPCFIYFG